MTAELPENTELDTRIFLPNWWVSAYDSAVSIVEDRPANLESLLNRGLFSAMTVNELNAFAVILSKLQNQILYSGSTDITLNPLDILSKVNSATNNKRIACEKMLMSLGGLRFQVKQSDNSVGSERIFNKETWISDQDNNSEDSLVLTLANQGAELLLGYRDLHYSLSQYVDGNRSKFSAKLNYSHPPISLWKSIWLDLQGCEQAILLQLEKKMQWSNEWLNLDGIFETTLEGVFSNLKIPGSRANVSEFVRRLKVLEKLGRKLVDHGFLTGACESGYLAFEGGTESEDKGFRVGWKIARERLLGEDFWNFSKKVGDYFAVRELTQGCEGGYRHLLPGVAVSKSSEFLQKFLPELSDGLKTLEVENDHPVILDGNGLISLPQLFVEWNLRQLKGNKLILPEDLGESEAVKWANPDGKKTTIERYHKFVAEFSEHPSYKEAMVTTAFVTVAGEKTLETPEFSEWLDSCKKSPERYQVKTIKTDIKPQLVFSQSKADEEAAYAPANEIKVKPRTAAKISKMRKIASEELLKLRSKFPNRYTELKSLYIGSLDKSEQRLILDVKKRMQSSLFEDHLRHHLVKFMIDHPASWTSAESASKN